MGTEVKQKFKKGDRVRCVDALGTRLRYGTVHDVLRVDSFVWIRIDGEPKESGWNPERFELVVPEELKVGDRVEVVKGDYGLRVGRIGKVTRIDKGPISGDTFVSIDGEQGAWYPNRFRKLEPEYTTVAVAEPEDTEPQEFRVGDKVICVDAEDSDGGLVAGNEYVLNDARGVGPLGEVKIGVWWWNAKRFHPACAPAPAVPEVKDTNPKDAIGIAKVPFSTLSGPVVAEAGLALMEGALKYGRHNYRAAGVRASVYYDAVLRHLTLWWEGQDNDPESGLSHVTKAMAGLIVLRDSMIQGNWNDDRPPCTTNQEWVKELNEKAKELLEKYPVAVEPWTQKRVEAANG